VGYTSFVVVQFLVRVGAFAINALSNPWWLRKWFTEKAARKNGQ